jgi:hypothetical protein
MDYVTIGMFIKLLAEGVGVVKEIQELAKRIQAGETVSQDEIDQKQLEIEGALKAFEAEAEHDQEG